MTHSLTLLRSEPPAPTRRLTLAKTVRLVWDSAWGALWPAFLVLIFGRIAFAIVGAIGADMVPSAPPGWTSSSRHQWHGNFFEYHAFAVIYSLVLLAKIAAGLAFYAQNPRHRTLASGLIRTSRKISRNWFGLTAGNALNAFVAVIIWQVLQRWSLSEYLTQCLLHLLRPLWQSLFHPLGADAAGSAISNLVAWFQANQMKFLFWLTYSAGICDDLGLPNYKTLTRWFYRRLRHRLGWLPANSRNPNCTDEQV